MRTRKTCLPLARLPACSRARLCLHNTSPIFVNYPTDKNTRPDSFWIIVNKPFLFVSQIYFRLSLFLAVSDPTDPPLPTSGSENRRKVTLFVFDILFNFRDKRWEIELNWSRKVYFSFSLLLFLTRFLSFLQDLSKN